MSSKSSPSYVISIRVSEAEKQKLDMLAEKRKRRPSSLLKSCFLQTIIEEKPSNEDRIQALFNIRKKIQAKGVIQRDPQMIIDEIRKFRGDES